MKNTFAMLSMVALFAAGTAHAQDAAMRVNLSDLNMGTEAGAKAAFARIRYSTASFCEQTTGRVSLQRATAMDRCVDDMMHRSVRQLNKPLVTALLEGRVVIAAPTQIASR